MLGLARLLIAAFCALALVGAVAIFVNAPEVWVVGVVLIVTALGGIAALVLERTRYRSARAEPPPGQARSPGGERLDQPIAHTFEATDEIFVDPTSGRRMRVFLDPSTGSVATARKAEDPGGRVGRGDLRSQVLRVSL